MLKRTPFYACHRALNARLVEFGGWEMPVQYSSILNEHAAVRNQAGLFDISHMGRYLVKGSEALAFLQYVATCDVAPIAEGQASYGLLCHPNGGIVDDIFIYRLPEAYLVVVNAANRQKDWDWLQKHTSNFNVTLEDWSEKWAMLALQGPMAEKLLAEAGNIPLANLPFHQIAEYQLFGLPMLLARSGYTGEDGFELFFAAAEAPPVWEALLALGAPGSVLPCGLGARDSLRFEPCLSLYGHEITDDINPYEARLGWAVKLTKGDFIGHEALEQIKAKGLTRRLVGFEMVGRGIARGDYPIQSLDGQQIGTVTTGMPSPTLDKALGLGYVPSAYTSLGSEFDILIRQKPVRAKVISTPFYKPRYKKG